MAIRRRPAKCLVGWSVKYLRCSRSRPRPDCQRTGQRQRDTSSPNTAEPRGNARLPRRAGIAAPTVNSRPTAPRPRCGRCGSAASRLPTPWLIRADTGLSDHSCLFHPDCASENCRTPPASWPRPRPRTPGCIPPNQPRAAAAQQTSARSEPRLGSQATKRPHPAGPASAANNNRLQAYWRSG